MLNRCSLVIAQICTGVGSCFVATQHKQVVTADCEANWWSTAHSLDGLCSTAPSNAHKPLQQCKATKKIPYSDMFVIVARLQPTRHRACLEQSPAAVLCHPCGV
jgi:hypothetical protein